MEKDEQRQQSLLPDVTELETEQSASKPDGETTARSINRLMYSQLNPAVRPIDRLRRPSPSKHAADDSLNELVSDLHFDFNLPISTQNGASNELSAPADPTLENAKAVEADDASQIELITISEPIVNSEANSFALTEKQPEAAINPAIAHPKSHGMRYLIASILVVVLIGAGIITAKLIAAQHNKAVAAQQADAAWKQEQAQWQCTLKQYRNQQAQQASNAQAPIKEISCPK